MSTTPEYMPWEEQSLKTKLFTFHGRLSRRHYIYLTILTWVLAGAISYLLHTASATLGTMTGGICLIPHRRRHPGHSDDDHFPLHRRPPLA